MILMDLKARREEERKTEQWVVDYLTSWQKVFLIWPKEVEGKLVWLERVERKYNTPDAAAPVYRFKERDG